MGLSLSGLKKEQWNVLLAAVDVNAGHFVKKANHRARTVRMCTFCVFLIFPSQLKKTKKNNCQWGFQQSS